MKYGYLSQFFTGVAAKRLRAVEADPKKSNQHEFNGVSALKALLGAEPFERRPTAFVWLGGENEGVSEEAWVTWYDSRVGKPRAAEWRLYFPPNAVMDLACAGDLLVVARRRGDDGFLVIVTPSGSTVENQLAWLFGLDGGLGEKFRFERIGDETDREIDFTVRYILDEIGVEFEEPEGARLDALLERFGGEFPSTRVFSAFTRETLPGISPLDDPDAALMAWLTHEEALFRRLERRILTMRLGAGFMVDGAADVDGFLKFSLSVQNRRKARMGLSLENHLEVVLRAHGIRYDRGAQTENRATPDFLFPGVAEYHDPAFPAELLTMLGAKSTCKDRWRQVLAEADRISVKHLLTIEPGISQQQTEEMKSNFLQIVVPKPLHSTYSIDQNYWLMDIKKLIKLLLGRQ
ncbi:MAG: type II restriction endonuclease, partial [Hyphomonas sp.]|nr:type II restriction endonuclease [Hyphomonas sp.]